MSVQFEQGILVWSCSNIEHQAQFRLQVLANALKEPPMGVNFSIVSMLDAEANVDTSSLQHVVIETYIPSSDLKDMQKIAGHVLVVDLLVHDFSERLHFEFSTMSIFRCETF